MGPSRPVRPIPRLSVVQVVIRHCRKEKLDFILARRREISSRYRQALSGLPGVTTELLAKGRAGAFRAFKRLYGENSRAVRERVLLELRARYRNREIPEVLQGGLRDGRLEHLQADPSLVDPLLAWSIGFWLSVGATAGVIGCLEALEAIKYLSGVGTTLKDRMLIWDGEKTEFIELPQKKITDCPVCGHLNRKD